MTYWHGQLWLASGITVWIFNFDGTFYDINA